MSGDIHRNPSDKGRFVKSGKGHYEFDPNEKEPIGLPLVTLKEPLMKLKDDVSMSGRNIEQWLGEWYGKDVIKNYLKILGVSSISDIFGSSTFTITTEEIYYQHLIIYISKKSNVLNKVLKYVQEGIYQQRECQ